MPWSGACWQEQRFLWWATMAETKWWWMPSQEVPLQLQQNLWTTSPEGKKEPRGIQISPSRSHGFIECFYLITCIFFSFSDLPCKNFAMFIQWKWTSCWGSTVKVRFLALSQSTNSICIFDIKMFWREFWTIRFEQSV